MSFYVPKNTIIENEGADFLPVKSDTDCYYLSQSGDSSVRKIRMEIQKSEGIQVVL